MKKIILMLMVAAVTISAASAQTTSQQPARPDMEQRMRSPEDRATHQTNMMAKRLNLTDAQRQAVYDANLAKAKQMQSMTGGSKSDMRQVKTQYENALRQTLTSDQYAQYETMKQERKARRMRHMSKAPQNGLQPEDDNAPVR